MISGSWLEATAVPMAFPGAAALVDHTHSLSPWTYVNTVAFSFGSWHGRYYPMKSVLYIFFTIGHTYTDVYIYLYKIYLS